MLSWTPMVIHRAETFHPLGRAQAGIGLSEG
jgi:hypothetical protein